MSRHRVSDLLYVTVVERPIQTAVGIALIVGATGIGGCMAKEILDEESHTSLRPPTANLVQESYNYTYHGDGGEWDVECQGPYSGYRIELGDNLTAIVDQKVINASSNALGVMRLPQEAIVEAVADINEIADPGKIEAEDTLRLPFSCEVGA